MRTLVLLFAVALVAVFTRAPAPAAGHPVDIDPTAALRVAVQPAVVKLHERSTITISGLASRSLQVRLGGATYANGTPLPWLSLAHVGDVWRGRLQTPALRGIYPIELRTSRAAALIDPHLFLRVFEPGTSARPEYDDPAEAVRWWVPTVPHATLVASNAWPLPALDRRDIRLHRLFVVAYSPLGYSDAGDRPGHVRHGGPERVPRTVAAPRGDCRAAMRFSLRRWDDGARRPDVTARTRLKEPSLPDRGRLVSVVAAAAGSVALAMRDSSEKTTRPGVALLGPCRATPERWSPARLRSGSRWAATDCDASTFQPGHGRSPWTWVGRFLS